MIDLFASFHLLLYIVIFCTHDLVLAPWVSPCTTELWLIASIILYFIIGGSLSKPHTSVTTLSMCVCVCVSVYTCLFGLTTNHKFQISAFNYFTMSTPTCTSAKPWEQAWRATARLQGRCERERERRRFKLNVLAARMAFWTRVSLMITWQGRLQVIGNWMYVGFRYALGMTAHT